MSSAGGFECNLADPERDQQFLGWKNLVPLVITKEKIEGGFRVAFDASAHGRLEELIAIEQRCCGWASWSLYRRQAHTVLEVRGPAPEIEALGASFRLSQLGIGEVSRRSGIPATTLRYYEEVGLLASPPRQAGRRQYGEEVLDTLTIIGSAREADFGLDEIRALLDAVKTKGPGRAWRMLAETKRAELTEQLQRVQAMLDLLDAVSSCECRSMVECAERLRPGKEAEPARRGGGSRTASRPTRGPQR